MKEVEVGKDLCVESLSVSFGKLQSIAIKYMKRIKGEKRLLKIS